MPSSQSIPYKIAIIGGGPNCVYALERIAALSNGRPNFGNIHIHIYDANGKFGCGEVHDKDQSETSLLNRIAGQINFGCDDSSTNANYILPENNRFDFMQWVESKFQETGDDRYLIGRDDWPPRYLHGLALRDAFFNYVKLIETRAAAKVFLHEKEVVDVRRVGQKYSVIVGDEKETVHGVNDLLFATGNQTQEPRRVLQKIGLDYLDCPEDALITSVYPLDDRFPQDRFGPDAFLGVRGTGVTSIDILLYLTQGRGGHFEYTPEKKLFKYHPSGLEPGHILMIARSGLFCEARPRNEKSKLPGGIPTEGKYFNHKNIEKLIGIYGVEKSLPIVGLRKQLDFERHVLPLMILEMAVLYYSCLLGDETAHLFHEVASVEFDSFMAGPIDPDEPKDGMRRLIEPLHRVFSSLLRERLISLAAAKDEKSKKHEIWVIYVLRYFSEKNMALSAGHETQVIDHLKFDWDYIVNPFSRIKISDSKEYLEATIKLIDRDLWEARRGNLSSPLKYACDTVWRDYRPVLTDCVDFGGLTPASQRMFLTKYLTIHNRIADGPSLTVIEKLRALIVGSVIDISLGPGATVEYNENKRKFQAVSKLDQHDRDFDVLCLAFLERFDVRADSKPLFGNLLKSGLISPWNNDSEDHVDVYNNGIALNEYLNPVSRDGHMLDNVAFIGPPVEGLRFFHHTLSRPDTVQPTIKNLVSWGNRLENRMAVFFLQMVYDGEDSKNMRS